MITAPKIVKHIKGMYRCIGTTQRLTETIVPLFDSQPFRILIKNKNKVSN